MFAKWDDLSRMLPPSKIPLTKLTSLLLYSARFDLTICLARKGDAIRAEFKQWFI